MAPRKAHPSKLSANATPPSFESMAGIKSSNTTPPPLEAQTSMQPELATPPSSETKPGMQSPAATPPSTDSAQGTPKSRSSLEKPRLTDKEKKANHIASEQKRRQAIRHGFDRLTELVPGLEGKGRSEQIVLKNTVDYMRKTVEDRKRLIADVEAKGGVVSPELRNF
ncbi:MAG: hypothetical protein M1824_000313 [Vezdaea acicularis]|nr:MAG: hypothetical protein M1824_000313 [Vezdaea acicularis]